MSITEAVERVFESKKRLEDPDVTTNEIITLLGRLDGENIDKSILTKTKIGMVVSRLRKHEDAEVCEQSKKLVSKWKVVAGKSSHSSKSHDEQAETTDAPSANAPTSGVSVDSEFPGPTCKDDRRNKVREILFKSFIEGVDENQRDMMDVLSCGRIAAEIEHGLHEKFILADNNQKDYTIQVRTIKANLVDKKNPELNARIYLGAIAPEALASMSSVDMASDAKKNQRDKSKKESLEACQSDWDLRNIVRAPGQFPCRKCKSGDTTYFQMQTRSADEPMTTYVTCLNCNNHWKF